MAKQQTAGQLARKARGLKGSYKGRMMPPDEVTRQLEIIWNEMAEIKHVTPLELESLYNKDTFYATPKLMSSYDAIFYQTMGHYFEACVFASFVAISNTLSRQNVPAEKVKQVVAAVKPVQDATGSQGFAKEINLIRSWANGTGISYFRYATDEEKQRNNGQSTVPLDASERAKIQKVVAQAKLACEVYSMKMAQAFFNEHWHGDKDINIKISNISGTGGQGETLGDLLLQLNGKPFILELKWQEKGNYTNGYGKVIDNTTNRFLRWFTSLSGDKLGGQGFNNQLVKKINAAGFWGTNLLNDVFLQKLSNVLLQQVALVGGGQPNHIFNFLLHKGKAYNVDSLGKIGVNANEGDIIPKVVFQFSNQRLKFSFTDLPTEVTDSAFQAQAGRAKLNQSYTNKQRTIEMMKDKFSLKFLLGQQITAGIFTPAGIEKIDNAKQKYGPNKYNFSFNFGVSSVALQRFVAAKQAAIF